MSTDKKTFTTVGQGIEHLDLYKWANLDVTAEKLYNLRGNGYAAGLSSKRHNLILSTQDGRPWPIEVLDPENEVDEELQTTLERMFTAPTVDYWSKLHMAFDDTDWYGLGFFNPVWESAEGEIVLTKLRHLPAHTFDRLPPGYKLYSQILQGVVINAQGEVEYWQRQDPSKAHPDKLDAANLFTVKNPACGELAGDPFMRPLFPFFSMLEYCWNSEMQLAHRIGVPTIFPKLTGPAQPASDLNGGKGDLEYMEEMAMYWGKDSAYPLRDNMTIETLKITESDIVGEIIDRIHRVLIEYSSPSSFVNKDGTLIGGSDKQAGNLMNMYINGTRTWLANGFINPLLQYYLTANGYEGYKAYVKVPLLSEDQADVRLREAELGVKYWTLDYNEVRERLKAEGLDEESIRKIIEFWRANQPVQQPVGAPGFTLMTTTVPTTHAPGATLSGASGKLVEDTYGDLSKSLKTLEDDILKALEEEHSHQDHEHSEVGE